MKIKLFIVGIVLASLTQLNAQERVYMPFFEVMNMHHDYQYSTSKLFKAYVDKNNKYQLIIPERVDSLSTGKSIELVRQKAAELNCTYFIQGELNRLGDIVIINVSMYNTSDSKKIWTSLLKASTPDDIDPIMEKMASTLGSQNQVNDNSIYNVSGYEAKELNKIGANRYFGVSVGGGYAFVSHINKNFPAGFGVVGSYDMRNLIFNIKGELYFSDADIYYFDIDAIYPFSSLKNSAFLSGGMGYGGVTLTSNQPITSSYTLVPYSYSDTQTSEGGLLLFAGGGYLLNRNSDVSVRFAGNFFFPLFKVGTTIPVGVLISTTLLFGK
jgi:hypothetical protein